MSMEGLTFVWGHWQLTWRQPQSYKNNLLKIYLLLYHLAKFSQWSYYRNWPRYGLCWSGLCCHSRHSTSGAGCCAAACGRAGRPHECCAGSGSTNHSSTDRIVVNFYSTTKTKQYTTINLATIMTMSRHAETPWLATPLWWWKRP